MDYNKFHKPILIQEILSYLNVKENDVVVDCTLGMGGHTEAILKNFLNIQVIGMDIDEEALAIARERLSPFNTRVKIIKESYINIDKLYYDAGEIRFAAVLFDLGVSLYQLTSYHRGFSFQENGPLDMRMDRTNNFPLSNILKELSLKELTNILQDYGEERNASKIAQAIFKERYNIKSTGDLKNIVEEIKKRRDSRVHPATTVFQAFRIYINKELDNISYALSNIANVVKSTGRIIVISYHSLEDRIVKNIFKEKEKAGKGRILTKKVIKPTRDEIIINPRARSAKLRVFEVY